jgi:hypothetical protein
MATRTDEPVEFETIRLTSGSTGIRSTSGEILDVAFLSVANLPRLSQADLDAVFGWVAGERERLAERAEQAHQVGREIADAMEPTLETQAAGRKEWISRNWSPET